MGQDEILWEPVWDFSQPGEPPHSSHTALQSGRYHVYQLVEEKFPVRPAVVPADSWPQQRAGAVARPCC